MRRIAITLILAVFMGIAAAETRQELVIDCDKHRTDATTCTACNIYHEARNQPIAGQLAVALVTRNRVVSRHYPSTMCETVWEARKSAKTGKMVPMFSWTLDGAHDRVYNKERWEDAVKLAEVIVKDGDGEVHDFTLGALWYHHTAVHPFWADHYHPVKTIGDHIFYVAKEEHFLDSLAAQSLPADLLMELIPKEE